MPRAELVFGRTVRLPSWASTKQDRPLEPGTEPAFSKPLAGEGGGGRLDTSVEPKLCFQAERVKSCEQAVSVVAVYTQDREVVTL